MISNYPVLSNSLRDYQLRNRCVLVAVIFVVLPCMKTDGNGEIKFTTIVSLQQLAVIYTRLATIMHTSTNSPRGFFLMQTHNPQNVLCHMVDRHVVITQSHIQPEILLVIHGLCAELVNARKRLSFREQQDSHI